MNVTTLAISTMAFGAMIGITATHFHHVNHLVDHGVPFLVSPVDAPVDAPIEESSPVSSPVPKPSMTLASSDIKVSERPSMPMVADKGNDRDDAVLEILTAMRDEQKSIRRQISESNRDLDELTFRVDTHSDSFKPLHADVERPRSLDSRIDSLDAVGGGLLPPKQ